MGWPHTSFQIGQLSVRQAPTGHVQVGVFYLSMSHLPGDSTQGMSPTFTVRESPAVRDGSQCALLGCGNNRWKLV